MNCKFDLAWRGACNQETEGEFCAEHTGLKCSSCGEPATRQCEETMGLVCGALLCGNCEHEIAEDGTNGRSNRHCKKSEQKYTPWYMRDEPKQQS